MPSDREQARAAGMNGFLVKPIPLESLRAAIAAVALPEQTNCDLDMQQDQETKQSMAQQLPDWDKLSELLGGNLELAREVVDLMRFEAPRLVRVLGESCALEDKREARRAAHTLKSNLRNLGLNDVAELAGQIEGFAQANDWSAISTKVAELESRVRDVVHWCDEMLAL